jgi:Fe-S oxidoreductase
MNTARVNYAALGQKEQCTGDSARRAGNEYLFAELANANVKILNEIKPKRIVTTCPHCLNTIKNDYPAFGGYFQVIHHTQMIKELIDTGRLELKPKDPGKVTYHDPCYLGRHNQIYAEPRILLKKVHHELVEMPRHGAKSFCCGAGGAQMWKEEEHGTANVNHTRFAEAKDTGVDTIAVGCPFCMTMLSDASKANGGQVKVLDIAEIVSSKLR